MFKNSEISYFQLQQSTNRRCEKLPKQNSLLRMNNLIETRVQVSKNGDILQIKLCQIFKDNLSILKNKSQCRNNCLKCDFFGTVLFRVLSLTVGAPPGEYPATFSGF